MEAAPTWAAGEASAEAANQLPAIGADGRDGGLPRAVLPRGNAGMMADVMPALPSRSSRLVQGRIARFVSDIAPGRVRLHSLRHNRGKEPAGFPRQPKLFRCYRIPFSDERCKPYLNTVAARYVNVHDDFDRGLALTRTIEDAWTRDSAFVSIGMAWVGAKDFESVIALVPEIAAAGRRGRLLQHAAEERAKAEGLEAGYAIAALIEDDSTRQEALYRVDRMRSDEMRNELFRGSGDIDAAFAMVPELKSSKARDELLRRMVWTIVKRYHFETWLPRALEAATRMTDVMNRDSGLREVAQGYARLRKVDEILSITDLASEAGTQRDWILLMAVSTYTRLEDIESARDLAERIGQEEPRSRADRFITRAEKRLRRRQ